MADQNTPGDSIISSQQARVNAQQSPWEEKWDGLGEAIAQPWDHMKADFGEVFPAFKAKGPKVKWPNLKGNPRTGGWYPKALENGRIAEQGIGDALNELKQVKQDLMDKMKLNLEDIADDIVCKMGDRSRPIALAIRVTKIISQIKKYIQDVQAVISAIQSLISALSQMLANLKGMIQTNLNAISNLMKELCNWHLPDLPAFPNQFGLFMDFQGLNFGPYTSNFKTAFDFSLNWSPIDCNLRLPNVDVFRNQPKGQIITAIDGTRLFYAPTISSPRWSGSTINLETLTQPETIALTQEKMIPVFSYPFNGEYDKLGSLPEPSKIVSNFHLKPEEYKENLPGIIFPELVPNRRDKDYKYFEQWPIQETLAESQPQIETMAKSRVQRYVAALKENIRLGVLFENGFEPNSVSLWLFWMDLNRKARKGTWLSENENQYQQWLTPSLEFLTNTEIPFNQVVGSELVRKAPENLPFTTIKELSSEELGKTLWRLSFLEEGLLGLPRDTRWDHYSDGSELLPDYKKLQVSTGLPSSSSGTNSQVYNNAKLFVGNGSSVLASYDSKSPFLTITTPAVSVRIRYEKSWEQAFLKVIEKGVRGIDAHLAWRTDLVKFKYFYDEFANVSETDRYFQYWKDFESRWNALVSEDPEFLSYIMADWRILDGVTNPLGDPSRYQTFKTDWESRDLDWERGSQIPRLPRVPGGEAWDGEAGSGWSSPFNPQAILDNPSTQVPKFNPLTFLSRPDIVILPLGEQMALMELNMAYASTLEAGTAQLFAVSSALSDASSQANSFGEFTSVLAQSLTQLKELEWMDSNGVMQPALGPSELEAFDNILSGATTNSPTGNSSVGVITGTPVAQGIQQFGYTPSMSNLEAGVACVVVSGGDLHPINPAQATPAPPYFDGVTITTPSNVTGVNLVTVYGTVVKIPGAYWEVGKEVYVGVGGALTQDYQSLLTSVQWIIPVGKALATDSLLYEPQLPTNIISQP